ncbi:MAG: hypothetical protein NC548_46785 [Lachnospiraceae bacterium]|nr:hypothetical protein [Lachnospiraceae bacterium]MCM1232877.1 hypothetical protein [Ruminococcus flavefaciens]
MRNIMQYEQWKELYAVYLTVRPIHKVKDFTYKGGDNNVTISTDQGNNRQITAGD